MTLPTEVQEFIMKKSDEIESKLQKDFYLRIDTCNLFYYGWSKMEYVSMPHIADELRKRGYKVSTCVRHGCNEFHFSV